MSDLVPEEAMRAACDAYDAAVQAEYDAAEAGAAKDEPPLGDHAEIVAVRAAAPLILAADLDRQAAALDEQAEALGAPRMDTSASGMVVVLRDLAEDARGRASVLRGEGDPK